MSEVTQPTRRLDQIQSVRTISTQRRRTTRFLPLALTALILVYFLAPLRTNILLLGTDDSPERGSVGRTDTIILTTVVPLKPYVGMLSIPRDLWVSIPGGGTTHQHGLFLGRVESDRFRTAGYHADHL